MRFAQRISLALLIVGIGAGAQNRVNPRNQIIWPSCQPGEAYLPKTNACASLNPASGLGGLPVGWVVSGLGTAQVVTAPGGIAIGSPVTTPTITLQNGNGYFSGIVLDRYSPTTFAELQAAVTACGINPCTIAVAANIPVTSNYTLPATVVLTSAGGQLQPSAGVTLTDYATNNLPLSQFFGGAGTVSGFSVVRPEWFGTTVGQAAALLRPGGTLLLSNVTYPGGIGLTLSNISVIGVGQPTVNAAGTAFIAGSGTIVQGSLGGIGSNLTFQNLGVDVGDTFNQCGLNGLGVSPGNIAAPMLYNINVENVTVLACDHTFAPSSQQHGFLFEHITGLTLRNLTTINGFYGPVIKAINVNALNITAINSYSLSLIIKSDDQFGTASNVIVNGLNLINTGPLNLAAYGATLSNVVINGLNIAGTTNLSGVGNAIWGQVSTDPGTSAPGFINGVKISGGNISGINADAISFQAGSTNIDLSHLNISNVTGNGVVFASTGATNNRVSDTSLSTVSLGGIYTFGATDMARGISCTAVVSGCLFSSGSGAKLSVSDIISTTTLATTLAGGSVVQGQFINPTLGAAGIMRSQATVTVTALNTPVSLPGTTSISGILALRDGTLGGAGAYLVDPNGLVTVLNNAQVPTITVTDSGGSGFVVQVAVTSGVVPRTIVWSLQGVD